MEYDVPKGNTLKPFQAVTLVLEGADGYCRVSSVHGVAELLLEHWPIDDGEDYVAAVHICLEAMLGASPPEAAREALIKAAKEAGIAMLQ